MSGGGGGISAVLIAKDEERDLPGALSSLEGAVDEIVVLVDAETADKTAEVASSFGAKVATRRFDGFGPQKQAALKLAAREWVLSLDCDERLTPELGREIREAAASAPDSVSGFRLWRRVYFMGRRMRFGGLGRQSSLRLFRRKRARFEGSVHETIEINGEIRNLRHPFEHLTYDSLSEYLRKLDLYTTLHACRLHEAGQRFHFWHHLRLPWEFFMRAFVKLGILDGTPGLVWAGYSAFYSWTKYLKLKEMECSER